MFKYRVKVEERSDLFYLFFWWTLILEAFFGPKGSYIIQVKKHWWSPWKTVKDQGGYTKYFGTYREAMSYVKRNIIKKDGDRQPRNTTSC